MGEVGLSGELRSVNQIDRRVNEASRLGFKRCLVPRSGVRSISVPQGMELVTASTLREAVKVGVGEKRSAREDSEL
jgi:DNA repair protein RadA/Sms